MGAFASGIAALPRIVTLHDLEIVPAGRDARSGGGLPGGLTLNVTAKTYRYLDEEEQEAGAADEKGDKKGTKKGKKPAGKD